MAGILNINVGTIEPANGQIIDIPFKAGYIVLGWSGANAKFIAAVSDMSIEPILNTNQNLYGIGIDGGKIINIYKESNSGDLKIKYLYDTDGYKVKWTSIGLN